MINLGDTIEEYLEEIERHENEVEEIEERRRRDQRLEGGGEGAAAFPNGDAQGEEVVARTAREIVSELARNAAAARETFMGDYDDNEGEEQESDDDTK